MKKIIGLSTLFLVVLIINSNAQVIRNSTEAASNKKAIEVGKEQLERDNAELAVFKTKVTAFRTAYNDNNPEKNCSTKKRRF